MIKMTKIKMALSAIEKNSDRINWSDSIVRAKLGTSDFLREKVKGVGEDDSIFLGDIKCLVSHNDLGICISTEGLNGKFIAFITDEFVLVSSEINLSIPMPKYSNVFAALEIVDMTTDGRNFIPTAIINPVTQELYTWRAVSYSDYYKEDCYSPSETAITLLLSIFTPKREKGSISFNSNGAGDSSCNSLLVWLDKTNAIYLEYRIAWNLFMNLYMNIFRKETNWSSLLGWENSYGKYEVKKFYQDHLDIILSSWEDSVKGQDSVIIEKFDKVLDLLKHEKDGGISPVEVNNLKKDKIIQPGTFLHYLLWSSVTLKKVTFRYNPETFTHKREDFSELEDRFDIIDSYAGNEAYGLRPLYEKTLTGNQEPIIVSEIPKDLKEDLNIGDFYPGDAKFKFNICGKEIVLSPSDFNWSGKLSLSEIEGGDFVLSNLKKDWDFLPESIDSSKVSLKLTDTHKSSVKLKDLLFSDELLIKIADLIINDRVYYYNLPQEDYMSIQKFRSEYDRNRNLGKRWLLTNVNSENAIAFLLHFVWWGLAPDQAYEEYLDSIYKENTEENVLQWSPCRQTYVYQYDEESFNEFEMFYSKYLSEIVDEPIYEEIRKLIPVKNHLNYNPKFDFRYKEEGDQEITLDNPEDLTFIKKPEGMKIKVSFILL